MNYKCTTWFAVLLLPPFAAAQTTQPAPDLPTLEASLPALRARLAELEAAFYKQHPTAPVVERHVAELRETYNRHFNRGTAALRELPNPREAADLYTTLRGEWKGVIRLDILKDPIVGPVIKSLLLSTPAERQRMTDSIVAADPTLRREDLADPEVLWRTMLVQIEKTLPESRRRFDTAVNRANLPDWIVAEAKTDAEYQGKIEMLDTWLNVVTPAALKSARRELTHAESLIRASQRPQPSHPGGILP